MALGVPEGELRRFCVIRRQSFSWLGCSTPLPPPCLTTFSASFPVLTSPAF